MEPLDPITPLTQDVTDEEVLEQTEPQLLCDTPEARDIAQLISDYELDEEFVRLELARKCRKHLHYWNNLQYLAWDEVAHDWRTPEQLLETDPQSDINPADYAKIVNVYKAHGEILIGALTGGLPSVRFFPNDADEAEDISTAKAFTKLAEMLAKYNQAKLLLMKAIFILYNQGMLACYNENKSDYRFGSIKFPEYGDVDVPETKSYCPNCGEELGQAMPMGGAGGLPPEGQAMPMAPPTEPEAPVDPLAGGPPAESLSSGAAPPGMLPQGMPEPQVCPQCQQMIQPIVESGMTTQRQVVGERKEPKNRECLELYGPLNAKFPLWCREQAATPYLILETEEPVALMREIYPELADRIQGTAFPDLYEKEARIPSAYRHDFPRNLVTVKRVWLRPWAVNLWSRELAAAHKAKFSEGCYVVVLEGGLVAEMIPDKLDDHWTIAEHPLAETLHPEPIGAAMMPMQDITNELTNLTLETIEFGIPEIFADTRVVDFDEYANQEARPGQITPAKAPAGMQLSGGFHEVKAATVSREIGVFDQRIEQLSQFVMGSYPSIYGGGQEGVETARGQELSKASALQRLSSTWTIVQFFYARVMMKAVKSHAMNMKTDEKVVQAKGSNFINVWVRKSELGGETADIEPEVSEAFPVSWSQKRDIILNLIQMGNEDINAVIRHPENAGLVAQSIGVPELFIPGDDSRNKQLMEIALLIRSEPMMPQMPPPQANPETGVTEEPPQGQPPPGQMAPQMQSSVPVDPDLDEHPVESEICKSWLRSEVGQDAKVNNPGGYANVLAHMKEHDFFVQQAAMAQAQAAAQGGGEEMDEKGIEAQGAPA